MFVDTHCHLDFDWFEGDRDLVIKRAREAGVIRILIPGIDLNSSLKAIRLAGDYPEVFVAVGIHPNEARSWDNADYEELIKLSRNKKVVAIGEVGLDYYRDRTPKELQRRVFQQQHKLAMKLNLPLVIHTRNENPNNPKAILDVLQIISEWKNGENSQLQDAPFGVLHSYSGNLEAARNAIELGLLIGITGPVTFKKSADLNLLVERISLEHLLIETDAPFLTPEPFRGKRNEPANVKLIAEKIAQIKNLPLEQVEEITEMNAERLFHWQAYK